MKRVLIGMIMMVAAVPLHAQDGGWQVKGMIGATYNDTDVSDNWTGSEKDSQNWGVNLDASAERDTAMNNWTTILKEQYGRARVSGADELTSADLIDLNSVYTRKLSVYVNPYVGFIMTTQNWQIFAPVTFTESIGNGVWIFKRPGHELKTRAGLAFRQKKDHLHGIADPETGNTVEVVSETGGEWITNYDVSLNEAARFTSEARVFSAFKGGANLRWDNSLFVKVSKLVTLQLNYLVVYNFDKKIPPANTSPVWPQDIEKRLILALGFSYNLF